MSFGSTEKSFVNFLINFEWLLTASCQTKLNEILNLEYLHEADFTEGAKLRASYKQNRRKSLKIPMRKFYPLIALEHVFLRFLITANDILEPKAIRLNFDWLSFTGSVSGIRFPGSRGSGSRNV